jgi:DNA modification methylase
MSPRKLTIRYLTAASLRQDPKNARLHSDKQVQQIARSIEVFGFNVPVLVDADLQVVAGHGRLLACKLLHIDQVPVIRLEHLSEHQRRAFIIADNRLTENGDWDDHLLGEQFKILSEAEIEFKLEVTGFETSEIDLFIENLAPGFDSKVGRGDALPHPPSLRVSRNGDLWQMGKHRLLCGNALSPVTYELLMTGHKAEMVFIDPPDQDPIDGHVTGCGKIHNREAATASDELCAQAFTSFLSNVFAQLARNSNGGALHFICMNWLRSAQLLSAASSVYARFENLCVWVRDSGGQGSLYRNQHELVFVFKCGKGPPSTNIQLGKNGRYRTNVWHYPIVNSLPQNREEGKLSKLHPTIKPVELVADAILDCTARGDVVLDPFCGSGTTFIGAERTGRVCYGIDLETEYVDSMIENGFVHIPEEADWLAEYLHEIALFPAGKYDDQVDSTSQALDWAKDGMGCLGVVELLKQISRNGGIEAALKSAGNPPGFKQTGPTQGANRRSSTLIDSRPCERCGGEMTQPIPGGLRCMQCGSQWLNPACQPRVPNFNRRDAFGAMRRFF